MDNLLNQPIVTETCIATVDSVIYGYFLSVLGYRRMGHKEHMMQSLLEMMLSIQKRVANGELVHHTTALNLLAQCWHMAGFIDFAIMELCASMEIEPSCRCNAAPWILAVIVYEKLFLIQADVWK